MAAVGENDIRKTLRHHDQQLASLTTEVSGIKLTLRENSTILNEISRAITKHEATPKPASLHQWVGTVYSIIAVIVVVGALLTSIIVSVVKPDFLLFTERDKSYGDRLTRIEKMIERIPVEPRVVTKHVQTKQASN